MTPTTEQLDTLRHMLGINDRYAKQPRPYRDYYAAPRGDVAMWSMAIAGLVERHAVDRYYDWYRTTEAGRAAALASHRQIRASREKRRYRKFLEVRDCWPDLTFQQFLTDPELREMRRNA